MNLSALLYTMCLAVDEACATGPDPAYATRDTGGKIACWSVQAACTTLATVMEPVIVMVLARAVKAGLEKGALRCVCHVLFSCIPRFACENLL